MKGGRYGINSNIINHKIELFDAPRMKPGASLSLVKDRGALLVQRLDIHYKSLPNSMQMH